MWVGSTFIFSHDAASTEGFASWRRNRCIISCNQRRAAESNIPFIRFASHQILRKTVQKVTQKSFGPQRIIHAAIIHHRKLRLEGLFVTRKLTHELTLHCLQKNVANIASSHPIFSVKSDTRTSLLASKYVFSLYICITFIYFCHMFLPFFIMFDLSTQT